MCFGGVFIIDEVFIVVGEVYSCCWHKVFIVVFDVFIVVGKVFLIVEAFIVVGEVFIVVDKVIEQKICKKNCMVTPILFRKK